MIKKDFARVVITRQPINNFGKLGNVLTLELTVIEAETEEELKQKLDELNYRLHYKFKEDQNLITRSISLTEIGSYRRRSCYIVQYQM